MCKWRQQLALAALPVLAALPAGSQSQATSAANAQEINTHDAPATFSTHVNLVMVPVVVRDGQGRAVGTLKQEDFQLFDKGKLQIITKFSIERPGTPAIVVESATDENAPEAPKPPPVALPQHFVAYLFDDVHLQPGDLMQARQAADRHLAEMDTNSRAAVYTTSGRTTLDFTDDREKLRDALHRIQPWSSALSAILECPPVTYYQADLIRNKNDPQALGVAVRDAMSCLHLDPGQAASLAAAQAAANAEAGRVIVTGDQETRVAMSVLRDVIRRLSAAPGSRSLVLISPGFLLTIDHREPETELMDQAIRANITVNSINAQGLFNASAVADASQRTLGFGTSTLRDRYRLDGDLANEDVLAELADATGGRFLHNTNDLVGALHQAGAQPEFVYVLGFSPQNLKFDGSFHALKVALKDQRFKSLQARRGYYAPRHAIDPETEAKEEIREALFSREELRDIPLDLNMQFFKSSDANARLSVVARVDVKGLRFRRAEDRNLDILTVVSGVFDRNGNYLSGFEKIVAMRLRDQTLQALPASGINLRTTFDLTPGAYAVRVVVRDAEGQMMAARNGAVQIP